MIYANFITCLIGTLVGMVSLVRHLHIFSNHKRTIFSDAWLVAVGTLAWSLLLYSSIDSLITETMWLDETSTQYQAAVLARVLILIYWIGDILKIKRYCLNLAKKKRLQARGQYDNTSTNIENKELTCNRNAKI